MKSVPKLRVAGSTNPVSRSKFRCNDEGFHGDVGALSLHLPIDFAQVPKSLLTCQAVAKEP